MAIGIFANKKIYVNGYDVSGYTNQLTMNMRNDLQDSTSLSDSGRVYTPGHNEIEFSAEGFWEPTVDGVLHGDIGADTTEISWYSTAGTANSIGYGIPATIESYAPDIKVGQLRAFSIGAKATGKVVRLTTLDGVITKTSTFDGDVIELGAVTAAQKVYSFVHVIAASGTSPTLDVTIRSDDNEEHTSATTRITHTQLTDVGSEVKSADGAITDTWWSVRCTIGGSDPSFTAIVGVGII